jgi:hypothetical protein
LASKEQQVDVEKDGVFLSRTDQGTLTLAQIASASFARH